MISVGLLNKDAAMELVEGVNDEEKADFVINLAKCRSCDIAVMRHDEYNNISIVTIFDKNYKHKVAYGKKAIKNLTHEPNDKGGNKYAYNIKRKVTVLTDN